MRSLTLVAATLLLTVVVVCTAFADQSAPARAAAPAPASAPAETRDLEIAKLKLQIQKLEAEKELLSLQLKVSEKKIAELERAGARQPAADELRVLPYLAPRRDSGSINPFVPIAPQSNTATPKSWVPREFNGQTYYVIPLKETQELSGTGTVTKSAGSPKP
jgi:hypothetical protein